MLATSRKSAVTRSPVRKSGDAHYPSSTGSDDEGKDEEMKKALDRMDSIVTHYKYLVGEQERKLQELKLQIAPLQWQAKHPESQATQQGGENQQNQDPHARPKGQLGKDDLPGPLQNVGQLDHMPSDMQEELEEFKRAQEVFQRQLAEKDVWIEYLKSAQIAPSKTEEPWEMACPQDPQQIAEMKQELSMFRSQLKAQSLEIAKVWELLKSEALAKSVSMMTPHITGTERRLLALLQEIEELKNENKTLREQKNGIKKQLDSAGRTIASLQNEKSKLQMNMTDTQKEQDDLLVLLNEQRNKIVALKEKLKDCGHPDEDEDELYDEDDDMNLYA